ncbi:MAG TPA: zf-HC2 domain-containing protein [Terracidiphilus sp.]|nr:zf-HC2 domain-containing protein [Terracidiphilus sp.]
MNHNEIDTGLLRAYLDGETDAARAAAVSEHLQSCVNCQAEIKSLEANASGIREAFDGLPQTASQLGSAWVALKGRLPQPAGSYRPLWPMRRSWSLAGAGALAAVVALLFTLAPVRAWAQRFLAIFRVEQFTVLELNPDAMKTRGLDNDAFFNQAVSRMISNEVTVTEPPRQPEPVADAGIASKLAGFPVQLLAGERPETLLFRSGISAQMKLDRDRMQSILDEAGRNDIRIPESVDRATIAVHIPAGITALYGNCGDMAQRMQGKGEEKPGEPRNRPDESCISLIELRSPSVTAPRQVDPAEVAQVALQFFGMNASEAASFTQTVDWSTTLVLPVMEGATSYEKIPVNGNDGVLLRPKNGREKSRYSLLWVDRGVVYDLNGTGDDTAARNLAAQLE